MNCLFLKKITEGKKKIKKIRYFCFLKNIFSKNMKFDLFSKKAASEKLHGKKNNIEIIKIENINLFKFIYLKDYVCCYNYK